MNNAIDLTQTKSSSNFNFNNLTTVTSDAINLTNGYKDLVKGYSAMSKDDKRAIRKACQGVEVQAVDIQKALGGLTPNDLATAIESEVDVKVIKTANSSLIICKNNEITWGLNLLNVDLKKFKQAKDK